MPAVAALLRNPSAQIREEALDRIIDNGDDITGWHEPLVLRPELSVRAIRRIATFVARSLVETLVECHQLDAKTETEIRQAVEGRIRAGKPKRARAAAEDAEKLFKAGKLDPETVSAALERGDNEFVVQALCCLSGLPAASVDRILSSESPQAVTAMAWRAGLGMRDAMRVQSEIAKLPPKTVLNARNGVDYPMSEDDMLEQLAIFAA